MAAYVFELDPWQRGVLDAWLSRDSSDHFDYTACGLSVPRQNGKNAIVLARELYGMLAAGETILHTAHHSSASKKAFWQLLEVFEDDRYPELRSQVRRIRRTNGEELIELENGASIQYAARTRSGSRGETVDVVVFDEAQELTDDQAEAIVPTMAAAHGQNRQMIYLGTPPGPNSPGTVFPRMRATAIDPAGGDPGTCWHEWGVSEIGDVSDEARWAEANPALGIRITDDWCRHELSIMSPDGFARERLGWWAPGVSVSAPAIPAEVWELSAIDAIGTAYDGGGMAFGVKFAPDGSRYSLAGCKRAPDGRAAVEIVEAGSTASGCRPLAEALASRASRASCVCIDGLAGADPLCSALSELGVPRGYAVRPRSSDLASACAEMLDALRDGSLVHTSQEPLDDAVARCPKRQLGRAGGWGFDAADGGDPIYLESAALAFWALKHSKRNPERKQRLL